MRDALVAGDSDLGFDPGSAFNAKFHVTLSIRFAVDLCALGPAAAGDAKHRTIGTLVQRS
jgi:hypothetical protein